MVSLPSTGWQLFWEHLMRELTSQEIKFIGGGGDIADAVGVGGAVGATIGYVGMGPAGAMAGAVYGGCVGLAWGVGQSMGKWLYDQYWS